MTETFVAAEIARQPDVWRQAVEVAKVNAELLPAAGARVAVVGCGTSWFMAQAYAARREALGQGETDAFVASEYPEGRNYYLLIAITRSGTTTEVLDLLGRLRGKARTLAVIGDPDSPGVGAADSAILLPFADEQSVVQTRYATAALTLLRASLGEDLDGLIAEAERVVEWEVPAEVLERTQFTYLGRGMAYGLANEAALKLREAAVAWAESYPSMDWRHGPKAIQDTNSVVTLLGEQPSGLPQEAASTGAIVQQWDEDPQHTLVRCQKLAVALSLKKGFNPDQPRNLTRSIILEDA
ncbi:MAG TPA: sugar isomerase [Actinomycetales bacterium]|nr:sugar isomerase [Actinomycetales bacterium]